MVLKWLVYWQMSINSLEWTLCWACKQLSCCCTCSFEAGEWPGTEGNGERHPASLAVGFSCCDHMQTQLRFLYTCTASLSLLTTFSHSEQKSRSGRRQKTRPLDGVRSWPGLLHMEYELLKISIPIRF